MTKLVTKLGSNVVKKLFYDVLSEKRMLEQQNIDPAKYAYQAIQQREIAIRDIFEGLIVIPSKNIKNEDLPPYYEYLVHSDQKIAVFADKGILWEDYLTQAGLQKILTMYKETLIAKESAWHDGIFENIPHVTKIDEIHECTVNTNFLERQQGYRIAMKALRVQQDMIFSLEHEVRQHIYTSAIDNQGANYYKKLK